MGVSENRGTRKSSILIECSIINHPFGVSLFLETSYVTKKTAKSVEVHSNIFPGTL